MTNRSQRRQRGRARAGFSMLEILVVIAILGVLAGLSSAAYFKWIDTRRRDNTTETILTVTRLVQQQIKVVYDQANTEDIPTAVLQAAGGNRANARAMYINARLQQEFPTTYAQAFTPLYSLAPKTAYTNALTAAGKSAATATTPTTSTTLLLLALQQNRKGVSLNVDQLGAAIGDSDNDNLNEFLDGWGNPLQFTLTMAAVPTPATGGLPTAVLTSSGGTVTAAGAPQFGTATDISSTNLRLGQ